MSKRLFYLDFIRVFSIILIVIFHFNVRLIEYRLNAGRIIGQITDAFGVIGVSLFIILSGAALMLSYNDKWSLKSYLVKRFNSIYPLYWLSYGFSFLVIYWLNKSYTTGPKLWTALLTLIGMDGFLLYKIPNFYLLGEWFIGCIIVLYFFFPILQFLIRKYPVETICALVLLHLLLLQHYQSFFVMDIRRNPLMRLPDFVFGMLFIKYLRPNRLGIFIIALASLYLSFTNRFGLTFIYNELVIGISLFCVLAYLVSYLPTNSSFEKITAFLSAHSFSAFLLHHNIILQVMKHLSGKNLTPLETYGYFLLVLILSFGLAIPINMLGNKLGKYIFNIAKV